MTEPADSSANHPTATAPRGKRAWLPPLLIVLAGAAIVAVLRATGVLDRAAAILVAQIVSGLVTAALFVWVVRYSGLSNTARRVILWAGVLVGGGWFSTMRVEGMRGDLWLDFRPRPWVKQLVGAAGPAAASETRQTVDLAATTDHDYPEFLGPRRNATVADVRLDLDWSTSPPREKWRREVGEGFSAFSIVGPHAITQEQRDGREVVACYALETGEPEWTFVDPDAAPFDDVMGGHGPRATPTIAAGRVLALGSRGILNCLDGATGQRVWSRRLPDDAKFDAPHWGYASSPLVVEGRVIVSAGGPESYSLIAYAIDDGAPVWHAGTDRTAYASPIHCVLAGVPQIVSMNKQTVTGHALADGAVLWTHDWQSPDQNCTSPIAVDDRRLLVSSAYGYGASLFSVERGDDGAWKTAESWFSKDLKSKFATMVVHEGHVFGLDDGIMACLDLETGKKKWKKGRYGHGQMLLLGDAIVLQAEAGELVLIEPDSKRHHELATVEALHDKTWNTLAFSRPYLITRNAHEAVCFELTLAAPAETARQPAAAAR